MAITIQDSSATDVDFVRESFQMEDAVTQRGKLQFQFIGTTQPLQWGEDVYVYDGATKLWGGTVDAVTETDITVGGTTTIRYTYDCVDFSQLASRQIVAVEYGSTTAGAIATSLAGNLFLTDLGVSAGSIEPGVFVDAITFNYLPIETCLDELAELSGFFWSIDKDKNLNFQAVDSNFAPFDLSNTNQPYRSITFSERRGQFANAVFVRAGTTVDESSTVETQYGDGSKRVFVVGAQIGSVPTIEVDTGGGFSSKTVGVNGIGTASQWYYNPGTSIVSQDPGETVLASSHRVRITFNARFPIIISALDDESIAERAAVETGSGFYTRVIDALDVENLSEAEQKAESILQQYSKARLTVSYTTDTTGIEAGMSQLINLTEHGINARFLIERVSVSMLQEGTLRYNITGAATQTVAGWSYWKQKTRQDRKFVVRANETVNNLRTVKDDVTLSDAEPTYNTYAGAYTVNGADTYINGFHVG